MRNHYGVQFNRSHGDILIELCKQKRRGKQREEYFQSRDDELEFSRVPYSDPKQNRAFARDGN